jgi:hypothetical protein
MMHKCTSSYVIMIATVVSQKVLVRTFVMMQLCHLNDCGSLWLFSPFAIRVLTLLCLSACKAHEVHDCQINC